MKHEMRNKEQPTNYSNIHEKKQGPQITLISFDCFSRSSALLLFLASCFFFIIHHSSFIIPHKRAHPQIPQSYRR